MLFRVIVFAALIFIGFKALNHLRDQPPQQRKALIWKYAVYALVLAIVALAITGRLHWVGAAIALLIPLFKTISPHAVRLFPALKWLKQQGFGNPVLTTRFLHITVNMRSGQMSGDILAGSFKDSSLDDLSQAQLEQLLSEYQQQDPESARLLKAYLQRRFNSNTDDGKQQHTTSGNMDRHEALQILGLSDDATDKDIVTAHRKLMQKVHPDRGGSDYLAAKINQAKDFLLKT